MINLHESYMAELGFELAIPGSAVGRATDCALEPGRHVTRRCWMYPVSQSKIMPIKDKVRLLPWKLKCLLIFCKSRLEWLKFCGRAPGVMGLAHWRHLLRKHAYSNILKILPLTKNENFHIKIHIPAQNMDCGYSLIQSQRGGSNKYPQSMFLAK